MKCCNRIGDLAGIGKCLWGIVSGYQDPCLLRIFIDARRSEHVRHKIFDLSSIRDGRFAEIKITCTSLVLSMGHNEVWQYDYEARLGGLSYFLENQPSERKKLKQPFKKRFPAHGRRDGRRSFLFTT